MMATRRHQSSSACRAQRRRHLGQKHSSGSSYVQRPMLRSCLPRWRCLLMQLSSSAARGWVIQVESWLKMHSGFYTPQSPHWSWIVCRKVTQVSLGYGPAAFEDGAVIKWGCAAEFDIRIIPSTPHVHYFKNGHRETTSICWHFS